MSLLDRTVNGLWTTTSPSPAPACLVCSGSLARRLCSVRVVLSGCYLTYLLPTPLLLSSPLLRLPTFPQPQPPCAAYADPRYDTTPLLPVPPNRAGAVRNVPSTHPPQPYTVPLINLLGRTDRRLAVTSTCRYSEHRVSRISSRPHTTQVAYICDCDAPVGPIPPPTPPCYTPCRAVPAAPPVLLSADPLVFLALYTYIRVSRHLPTRWTRASLHTAPNHPMHCCYGLETAARPLSGRRHRLATSLSRTAAHTALHALWSPTRKTVSSAPI